MNVKEYAQKSTRYAVGARNDQQDIFNACCWVLSDGRHLFQAFPEVVCVNGTHERMINESRPLLTLSVKDSDGNVMVLQWSDALPQLKDLGYSVGYFKKPFLCF